MFYVTVVLKFQLTNNYCLVIMLNALHVMILDL